MMSQANLACPKCGNKDKSLMEMSETSTRTATHQIHFYELVCNVCAHVWSKRISAVPHKQVKHGE